MPEVTSSALKEQFQSLEQQKEAVTLGIWLFLATEVLFFGGLFLAYTVYRSTYPEVFSQAGRELNLAVGTINTALLLTSSYFMAMAVHSAEMRKSGRCAFFLGLTWVFGLTFLLLKAYEYSDDIHKHLVPGASIGYSGPHPEIARNLYFIYYSMTGLHALHLTIGLAVVGVMFFRALRQEFSKGYFAPLEVAGLYWHFVDLIWIFLYPLLYLLDRHS